MTAPFGVIEVAPDTQPSGRGRGPLRDGDEVLVTDPNTGGQKGSKLAQLGALDPLSLIELAKLAGHGAAKYDRLNFARGYAYSLSYDALQRHALAWASGEDYDVGSGRHHMAAVAFHALVLVSFCLRGRGTDDRLR